MTSRAKNIAVKTIEALRKMPKLEYSWVRCCVACFDESAGANFYLVFDQTVRCRTPTS